MTDDDMAPIPGGAFRMGSNENYPEERPVHTVALAAFRMDRHAVTNARFAAFVAAADYVTFAERLPDPAPYPDAPPDLLKPGSAVFHLPTHEDRLGDLRDWWSYVP